eukprot:1998221-Rhodomonas_salina.1
MTRRASRDPARRQEGSFCKYPSTIIVPGLQVARGTSRSQIPALAERSTQQRTPFSSELHTPRNRIEETAISVQFAPVMRFLVFHFGTHRLGHAIGG